MVKQIVNRACCLAAAGILLGTAGCTSGPDGYTQSPEALTPRVDIIAGDNQIALVNTAFATPMKVRFNKNGMALGGHPITFTAPDAGASGTFPNNALSVTVVADANGVAEAPVFSANGTAGAYTILAWNNSYRANFHLTNQ